MRQNSLYLQKLLPYIIIYNYENIFQFLTVLPSFCYIFTIIIIYTRRVFTYLISDGSHYRWCDSKYLQCTLKETIQNYVPRPSDDLWDVYSEKAITKKKYQNNCHSCRKAFLQLASDALSYWWAILYFVFLQFKSFNKKNTTNLVIFQFTLPEVENKLHIVKLSPIL